MDQGTLDLLMVVGRTRSVAVNLTEYRGRILEQYYKSFQFSLYLPPPLPSLLPSQFIRLSLLKYFYFLPLNGANKGFSKIQFASSQFSISPSKTHLLRISLLPSITKTRHSKKVFLIFVG